MDSNSIPVVSCIILFFYLKTDVYLLMWIQYANPPRVLSYINVSHFCKYKNVRLLKLHFIFVLYGCTWIEKVMVEIKIYEQKTKECLVFYKCLIRRSNFLHFASTWVQPCLWWSPSCSYLLLVSCGVFFLICLSSSCVLCNQIVYS